MIESGGQPLSKTPFPDRFNQREVIFCIETVRVGLPSIDPALPFGAEVLLAQRFNNRLSEISIVEQIHFESIAVRKNPERLTSHSELVVTFDRLQLLDQRRREHFLFSNTQHS